MCGLILRLRKRVVQDFHVTNTEQEKKGLKVNCGNNEKQSIYIEALDESEPPQTLRQDERYEKRDQLRSIRRHYNETATKERVKRESNLGPSARAAERG